MFDSQKIADMYDQIGLNFSATREKLSDSVVNLLPKLAPDANVLDLGCGNGVLLSALPDEISYLGIDISQVLLDEAHKKHSDRKFLLADILDPTIWNKLGRYDFIAALAVFHHLPTPSDHLKLMQNIKQHLKPSGSALISVWRLNEPKFDKYRTDANHFSIPFHDGPSRDFYAFSENELTKLAHQSGFDQIDTRTLNHNLFLTLS